MRNRAVAELIETETARVECTHCGVSMTSHLGSGNVRYYRCSGCHRWVSSTYADVLRADSKVRAYPRAQANEGTFGAVKDRLERWLATLDDRDPYHSLGVSPQDSAELIRARYHQLALERHPDRGGSLEAMRELNSAYERIQRHRDPPTSRTAESGGRASLPALHR